MKFLKSFEDTFFSFITHVWGFCFTLNNISITLLRLYLDNFSMFFLEPVFKSNKSSMDFAPTTCARYIFVLIQHYARAHHMSVILPVFFFFFFISLSFTFVTICHIAARARVYSSSNYAIKTTKTCF